MKRSQKSSAKANSSASRHRLAGESPRRTYKSPALAAVHEAMSDLAEIGMLDARTMREFDAACLTPLVDLTPEKIGRIRKRAGVSQAVFAAYINVTPGLVSKWERGEKQPRGPAAKLLSIAAKRGIEAIA